MNTYRRLRLGMAAVLVLIITIVPTTAFVNADSLARPMMSHDFTDVPVTGQEFMEPYIDAFFHQGITGGCSVSPLQYCPLNPVTRGSMAVFVGRALGYVDMVADGYSARAYFKDTTGGYGVIGRSDSNTGVVGVSSSFRGVHGYSTGNAGVYGESSGYYGVYGSSTNSNGVYATSTSASALLASTNTNLSTDVIYDIELGGAIGEIGSLLEMQLYSTGSVTVDLDQDSNSTDFFTILNGMNANVFYVDEAGNTNQSGGITATGSISSASTIAAQGNLITNQELNFTNTNGTIETLSNLFIDLDEDNDSTSSLLIRNGGNTTVFQVEENGRLTNNHDIISSGDVTVNGGDIFSSSTVLNFNPFLGLPSGRIQSPAGLQLDLDDDNNTAGEAFQILNGANTVVFSISEFGNSFALGTKSAIVDTVHYGTRALYAVESTEVWFEDIGRGQLVDGEAIIEFDPIFAETVNLDEDYEVFLTPIGGWADLYVEEMTATSFTVRSADGSDVQFSYRIVAKRLGYEDVRMEEVED